jgi:hypothetical protein
LIGCGTEVKVRDTGQIETTKENMAPVLMTYKFKISGSHELFFWDENKNRYNLRVNGDMDTGSGVYFYLPADRDYALSGFFVLRPSGRTEYSMGTELNMFRVKKGVINQIAYFEIDSKNNDSFSLKKTRRKEQRPYLEKAIDKFKINDEIRSVEF